MCILAIIMHIIISYVKKEVPGFGVRTAGVNLIFIVIIPLLNYVWHHLTSH